MIIATLVAIVALIFPIKRANEMPLFKWISKIQFEICINRGVLLTVLEAMDRKVL